MTQEKRHQLNRLNRILKGQGDKGRKIESPDDLIWIHHLLMKEYGWIPVDEFAGISTVTVWNLLECIQQDYETQKRQMDKAKRGRK